MSQNDQTVRDTSTSDSVGKEYSGKASYTVNFRPTPKIRIEEHLLGLKSISAKLSEPDKRNTNQLLDQSKKAVDRSIELLEFVGIVLPEERKEKYVKESELFRLKEVHSDESIYISALSLSVGSILGIIGNLVTADPIVFDSSDWLIIATFFLCCCIFSFLC